jgi:hypothetical protein
VFHLAGVASGHCMYRVGGGGGGGTEGGREQQGYQENILILFQRKKECSKRDNKWHSGLGQIHQIYNVDYEL